MNTYQDFLKGRFQGTFARSRRPLDGWRRNSRRYFRPGQPTIWSIARAPDGSIYAGTGHRGRVYQITASGASKLIWTSDQPEIFAVAVDLRGVLYAATSPDGKVYRIENGKATEFFAPQAKYIWSLAVRGRRKLVRGAGNPGNIYRVDKDGQSRSVLRDRPVARHRAGVRHARQRAGGHGTQRNSVSHQRQGQSVRAVQREPAGDPIHRSDAGWHDLCGGAGRLHRESYGALATTSLSSPSSVTVTAPATSITVTDSADSQADTEIKPKAGAPGGHRSCSPRSNAPRQSAHRNSGRRQIGRLQNQSRRHGGDLWSSKEENVYSLVAQPSGSLVFATDAPGPLYRLGPDRKATLMVETNEGEATRLLDDPGGLMAATGEMGKLFRLADAAGPSGSYESPVHDSRFGRALGPNHVAQRRRQGCSCTTRSGNSARPDKTWSDWSEPLTNARRIPRSAVPMPATFNGAPVWTGPARRSRT